MMEINDENDAEYEKEMMKTTSSKITIRTTSTRKRNVTHRALQRRQKRKRLFEEDNVIKSDVV